MNKADLVAVVSQQTGISLQDTTRVTNALIEAIKGAIVNENIEIRGFGRFKTKYRKRRKAQNLHTRKTITLPEKFEIVFEVSDEWQKQYQTKTTNHQ